MKPLLFALFIMPSINLAAQNVGIGTATPSEKLHVAGNVKMDTAKANVLKVTTGAGAKRILQSDATGNATWVNSNTIPGTIAETGNIYDAASASMPVAANVWEFAGATTNVTLNGNQRVVANGVAGLGKAFAGNTIFSISIGYQLQPGGQVISAAAAGFIYLHPNFNNSEVLPFAATASWKPAAGTYKIGIAVNCATPGYLDYNDFLNFTYTVINE
ncbi:MAG: hypothetical protein ABJA78_09405 [Ferruginibacter sp.]